MLVSINCNLHMRSTQHVPPSVNSMTFYLLRVSHHATDKGKKGRGQREDPSELKFMGERLLFNTRAKPGG